MADKVAPYYDTEKVIVAYQIFCPGCDRTHVMPFPPYGEAGRQWVFNGSLEFPSFTPSINSKVGPYPEDFPGHPMGSFDICHSYVTDGKIQFLADCTHALKGQTVPLPDFPDRCRPRVS